MKASLGVYLVAFALVGLASSQNAVLQDLSQIILGAMDQTVDPCVDFYQYACGSWIKNTPLPSDRPYYARSFSVLDEQNVYRLRDIMEQDWPIIGPYYQSCMDTKTVNGLGYQPLEPALNLIEGIGNLSDLMMVTGHFHPVGVGAFFAGYAMADYRNPMKNIWYQDQGGLGLPNKDYYFDTDNSSIAIRAEYVRHISRVLQLLDIDTQEADMQAAAIMQFEVILANASLGPVEMTDPQLIYNKMTFQEFTELTPHMDWTTYFAVLGMNFDAGDQIIVTNPGFYRALDTELAQNIDSDLLHYYLAYHLADTFSDFLSQPFVDEKFVMTKLLTGVNELPERWKRCVDFTNSNFPELVGRYFVMAYFAGNSKSAAQQLVHNLEAAYNQDFDELDWMDAQTRAQAKQKLSMITNMIGYPDKWKSYDDLFMKKDQLLQNTKQVNQWESEQNHKLVNQPVDKTVWQMAVSDVNAYYDPTTNDIVFPAAILQPPFFNVSYPNFANYGGIGMVIGHEISHGFDNTGSQFDGTGNLTDWWTEETRKQYDNKAQCVVDLFDSYEVLPGYYINGKLTEGENLADFGGIRQSFRAYHTAGQDVSPADMYLYFPSFTQDQLFFISYAQLWCTVQTDEYLEYQTATNPHSPSKFRVNGPTSNFEAFWDAFKCAEGTPMHPKDTCRVW